MNALWRFASDHSDRTYNGWHERQWPLTGKRIVLFKDLVMNATNGVKITLGQRVLIVLKKNQRSGKLTQGMVKDILTKSPTHPHGIKVRLESGEIGRVKEVIE
jgi:uncharacterized repeat protein (TIGR03833 family)